MVRFFALEENGGAHIDYSREEVVGLLEDAAGSFSTTSVVNGIRIEFDGAGEHTKKLPPELYEYVLNAEDASFMAHRDNQRRTESR